MKEEGTLSIGDLQYVIQLLGEVYRDSRDALAEFITNAGDANATKIYVFLHKRAKDPYIRVSDNGDGMTTNILKYVAENIGKSLKKYEPKSAGEGHSDRAFCLLAFGRPPIRPHKAPYGPHNPQTDRSLKMNRNAKQTIRLARESITQTKVPVFQRLHCPHFLTINPW